jgi:hypothetical protein
MPEKPRDYEAELRAIMDALAESVAEASDDDILAEAREAGEDPARTAARIRAVLRRAVRDYEQKPLREAQKAYEESVRSIRARPFSVPTTPEGRRQLFTLVMNRKPELGRALLTAQHREFKDLTDADIQSCLEQLGALGVLNEFERPPETER